MATTMTPRKLRRRQRRAFRLTSFPLLLVGVSLLVLLPFVARNGSLVTADSDGYYTDDSADTSAEEQSQRDDDDMFQWDENQSFEGVSVMPTSCLNYNSGQMIKFDLFLNDGHNRQCRTDMIGSFVVSIAHYMRAFFNYQALMYGKDFNLPGDAGYLNCILIQETAYSETQLYAKIGCMDRETFTSTSLRLHVYTDEACTESYDDGLSDRKHASKYTINGYSFSTKISFRPPFYNCLSCSPNQISDTFNKKNSNWYDDDYISQYGKKNDEQTDETSSNGVDDYFDDGSAYMYANDDVSTDDNGGRRGLSERASSLHSFTAAEGQLEAYNHAFWKEVEDSRRSLYDNNYDAGSWNICSRLYKYGVYCDEECRALEAFRIDEWSRPDVILLSILCSFIGIMMGLIVAKRVKAASKGRMHDGSSQPGLPPLAMAVIFVVVAIVIVALALRKFVNETLVFAVVTCILLFIYNLKLTLFEAPKPVLLEGPKHGIQFDNPLEDHLFS